MMDYFIADNCTANISLQKKVFKPIPILKNFFSWYFKMTAYCKNNLSFLLTLINEIKNSYMQVFRK
jgi:hypothetical protein